MNEKAQDYQNGGETETRVAGSLAVVRLGCTLSHICEEEEIMSIIIEKIKKIVNGVIDVAKANGCLIIKFDTVSNRDNFIKDYKSKGSKKIGNDKYGFKAVLPIK